MPAWAYWTLLASVFVVLATGVGLYFFYFRPKANTLLAKQPMDTTMHSASKASQNESFMQILTNEKAKTTNPMADEALIFAVNSFVRNGYRTVAVFGLAGAYEAETMRQMAKAEIVDSRDKVATYDMALVHADEHLLETIKGIYQALNPQGIIMVAGLDKGKALRSILYECRILGYRHEQEHQIAGTVWIAK